MFLFLLIPVSHQSLIITYFFCFFLSHFHCLLTHLKSMVNHYNHSNAFNFCSICSLPSIIHFLIPLGITFQPDYIYLSSLSDPIFLLLSGTGIKRTFIPMILYINLMTSMNDKKAFYILRQSYTIFFFYFPDYLCTQQNVFPLT